MSDVISDTKQSDRAFFGAIERYNAPLDTPTTYRCRRVRIPENQEFIAALNELIARVGFPDFWLERAGGMTPDECAALGSQLFYDYAESDGYCMIGEVKAVALATLPAHLLECNGATYQRVDYPDLYAALDAEFIVNADEFTVPDLQGLTIIGAGVYNPGEITYAVNELVGARRHSLLTSEMPMHTHVQNAHTHVQDAHNHTQNSHNHTQNSHNHAQQAHSHNSAPHGHTLTDPQHSHGMNHNHALQARSNSAAGTNAELMRSNGTGTDADFNTGLSSLNPTGTSPTGITLDTGIATIDNTIAANIAETATNIAATATNIAATATNQSTTATNQNAGGGQPHNNMQPSRALRMVIVAR